jgi:hypothetical protein
VPEYVKAQPDPPLLSKDGLWLDGRLRSWNAAGSPVPRAPKSTAESPATCPGLLRAPETSEEREVSEAGWFLLKRTQLASGISLVTGFLGVDGMCRPQDYQGFVFSRGVFAGTMSPVLMSTRTDGAMGDAWIEDGRVLAEFGRYGRNDPLCCASGVTEVSFELKDEGDRPLLTPVRSATHWDRVAR